jgi:hypothetical protein
MIANIGKSAINRLALPFPYRICDKKLRILARIIKAGLTPAKLERFVKPGTGRNLESELKAMFTSNN